MDKALKKKSIPHVVIMLGLVSLFTDIATEMIFPLIPVYITLLGSGVIVLGMIEGVAQTTASMLNLAGGIISDRSGRKKLMVLSGYAISSLVRPMTGLVTSAWQIVVIRMTDRIGKGIRTAPRDALIASSTDESSRGRAYGFDRAMDHAGALAGPLLAILTLVILFHGFAVKDPLQALRWTFIMAVVPGILAVLIIINFVSEPVRTAKRNGAMTFSFRDFDSNFRNYLLVMILFTLGNSSDAFLLFRVQEAIQESGTVVRMVESIEPLRKIAGTFGDERMRATVINILFLPLVWSFFHIIKTLFSTPMGSLSDRIGRKKVIVAGWVIYALVYFSFALIVFLHSAMQIAVTFVLFAIYALYYAFTEGTEKAFVADLVDERKRGTAFGMYNFSIGISSLPASIIFGFLYSYFDKLLPGYGGTFAFGFGGILAVISMLLLTIKVKEKGSGS